VDTVYDTSANESTMPDVNLLISFSSFDINLYVNDNGQLTIT